MARNKPRVHPPRRRRWLRRIVIASIVLFALYNILLLLVFPPLARSIACKKLTEALHRKVEIGSIRINPYALSLRIRNLRIDAKEGPDALLAFDEFYANPQLRSLFRRAPVLREVRLTRPTIALEREAGGELSIADLLQPRQPPPPPAQGESEPSRFLVERFRIVDGQFRLVDRVTDTTHTIQALNLSIPLASNMEDFIQHAIEPAFDAVVNDAPLRLGGNTKPFSETMDTSMEVNFERVDLPFYFKYVPVKTHFKPLAGELSVRMRVDFHRKADGDRLAVSGEMELAGLNLVDEWDKPLLKLPQFRVTMAPSNLLANDIRIAEIYIREPEIHATRDASGALNLLSLIELPASEPKPPTDSAPLIVAVDKLIVENGRTTFSDLSTAPAVDVTLFPININVANFSTAPGKVADGKVSMGIGEGETFNVSGTLCLTPMQADMEIALKDLGLARFRGYVPADINVSAASGRLGIEGKAHFALPPEKPVEVSYRGAVTLDDVLATDRPGDSAFLKLGALAITGIDFNAAPLAISADELSLRDLTSNVRVEKDGTLNLSKIAPAAPPPADAPAPAPSSTEPAAAPPQAPMAVQVKRVRLQNGKVAFADRSVAPPFESSLSNMDLTVDGFVLGGRQPVTVQFAAILDNYAPFNVQGTFTPDAANPFVDMVCEVKNLAMPRLSPYSRLFIGYDVLDGKFNLALSCKLDDSKVNIDPTLFLDQLGLSEKMDREKMKGMPISLAVALLKDRQGQIKLHVPITGDLNDPTFHVKQAVIDFFLNLVTKAATSPFALLASVMPGGEDLSYVEFVPGRAEIGPQAQEKLDTLVTALYERPGLQLVINAYADPATDTEAIQRAGLMQRLRVQKIAMAGGQPAEARDVEIRPDEYPGLIRAAFIADGSDRMMGAASRRRGVSTDEMEAVLLGRFTPTEENLRALATERAGAVRSALLASDRIDASRITIGTPETLAATATKGASACRVEFDLK